MSSISHAPRVPWTELLHSPALAVVRAENNYRSNRLQRGGDPLVPYHLRPTLTRNYEIFSRRSGPKIPLGHERSYPLALGPVPVLVQTRSSKQLGLIMISGTPKRVLRNQYPPARQWKTTRSSSPYIASYLRWTRRRREGGTGEMVGKSGGV